MIRCRLVHLERRCLERGYTWAEVEACVVSRDGDELVVDETHPAYPRPRPGLGDLVAAGLASVGITKARAQAVAAAVGIEDCGCQGRQEAWNLAGYRLGIGTPPPADFGPTG
jgi:hypothetical protein